MTAPTLDCDGVVAGYPGVTVFEDLDLEIAAGETVALLGPSGSGKSTLLGLAAGFLPARAGIVRIDGSVVDDGRGRPVPPERRRVGVVFQAHALWPHLSALETVAYPLRRSGMGAGQAGAEAAALLDRLGIGDLADRRPAEMSGGQQQRVGIARAVARRPSLFLLDEPAANLDAPLREAVLDLIAQAGSEHGAAVLHATHDAAEALASSDRVVLLRDGSVVQQGSPVSVYECPVDLWAARMTGTADVLEVEVADDGRMLIGETRISPVGVPARAGRWSVVVRPEWVGLGGPLQGVVRSVAFRGSHSDVRVRFPRGELRARVPGPAGVEPGDRTGWTLTRVWALGPDG